MLVLNREVGERLHVTGMTAGGESAELIIEVVRIGGNHVKLGLTAPLAIKVIREELLNQPAPTPLIDQPPAASPQSTNSSPS